MQQPEAYIVHAAELFDDRGDLASEKTHGIAGKSMNAFAASVEKHA